MAPQVPHDGELSPCGVRHRVEPPVGGGLRVAHPVDHARSHDVLGEDVLAELVEDVQLLKGDQKIISTFASILSRSKELLCVVKSKVARTCAVGQDVRSGGTHET